METQHISTCFCFREREAGGGERGGRGGGREKDRGVPEKDVSPSR